MKRVICLFLSLCTIFLLCACSNNNAGGETEVETTVSPYAGIVEDPHTWYEEFMQLPVPNASMTTDELRQNCVDYFRLQLSFTWTPNRDIDYTIANMNHKPYSLPSGIAYSGLCYAAGPGVTDGKGNVYKILNYYDPETGVLDIVGMGDKYLEIIGSCCSWGPCWAWQRISNSIRTTSMENYTYSYGALPVGLYTYVDTDYDWANHDVTTKIIQLNGDEVMYESYAQMLPADGLYSSPSWHIRMCASKPKVVRNADGSINPQESYVYCHEQGVNNETVTQSNGITLHTLGTVDRKYTFARLLETGYIPFTIPEFLGQEPVEEGKSWIGNEHVPCENGSDISLSGISMRTLWANYVISNLHVEVKDPSGKILYAADPYIYTRNNTFHVSLTGVLDHEAIGAYANGENTIHLYTRLCNGELTETFWTVLQHD